MWSSLLCLVLLARAQDVAPDAPALAPASIGEAAAWREERGTAQFEAGPPSLVRFAAGGSWLLGLEDGAIYRSMDGARTWSRVLRAPSEREDVDVEAALLEGETVVTEDEERVESSADSSEDAESAADTNETVVEDPEAEAEVVDHAEAPTEGPDRVAVDVDKASADTLLHTAVESSGGAVVWFNPEDSTVALAGRSDGIWRSTDGGLHWARVDSAADALRFLAVPSMGITLAGTSAGVRVSPDGGERWFDTVDVTDGAAVEALVVLGDRILAGTSRGLYASAEGLRWKKLPLDAPVLALLPDPGWKGGLWVATPTGLRRSDDGGATFYQSGRQIMPGLRGLAQLEGQGHVLIWGPDGVWESMDGGVTWHPIYQGLRDPDVRDVVVVGAQPVAAASRSIWRLGLGGVAATGAAGRRQRSPLAPEETELLGFLVDTATRRQGLDLNTLNPGALAAKAYLPMLMVTGRYGFVEGRDSTLLTSQTTERADGDWSVSAMLCFGGCSTSAIYDVADAIDSSAGVVDTQGLETLGVDTLPRQIDSLYALGDELVGEGSEAFAATNTAQNIRKYRQQVADQVAGAWSTIQRLDHTPPPPSLQGTVDRLLDIAEAEARLDLYTDGAYTRARTSETAL
ncbi:hypothetical protein LBMAG42_16400 [Deltaproteobacteria bacterium]|nr:hypothetical protein LBMAG42_16400 [Deltaproteobacteria bacterium]